MLCELGSKLGPEWIWGSVVTCRWCRVCTGPTMETLDGIDLYWSDLPTSMLTLFMPGSQGGVAAGSLQILAV